MADMKKLTVLLKEEGKFVRQGELQIPPGCGFNDLSNAVAVSLLGPEESRWKTVKEQRVENLDPKHGGGTIDVTLTMEAPKVNLWSHPHDGCCPIHSISHEEIPPHMDLYAILGCEYKSDAVTNEGEMEVWWNPILRAKPHQLRSMAMARLVAKMSVGHMEGSCQPGTSGDDVAEGVGDVAEDGVSGATPPDGDLVGADAGTAGSTHDGTLLLSKDSVGGSTRAPAMSAADLAVMEELSQLLMMEGVQGLWEVSVNKPYASRLGAGLLRRLVDGGLNSQVPTVLQVATAAVWNLVMISDVRTALLQFGVLEALYSIASEAVQWRESEMVDRDMCNRILFNILGAFGVLAVDGRARERFFKASPKLSLLMKLATMDFPTPQPPDPPTPTPPVLDPAAAADPLAEGAGPAEGQEGAPTNGTAAAADATAPATAATATPPADAGAEEGVADGRGAGVNGEGEVEEAGEGVVEEAHAEEVEPFVVAPEDDPYVHQKMSAEVLYTMLCRDRHVRRSLVASNGMAGLLPLLRSLNPDVQYCAVASLAAFARDAATDHSMGVDMLRQSGLALELVGILLPHVDTVIVLYSSGTTEFGSEAHPILTLLENLSASLWGSIMAVVKPPIGGPEGAAANADDWVSLDVVVHIAECVTLVVDLLQDVHVPNDDGGSTDAAVQAPNGVDSNVLAVTVTDTHADAGMPSQRPSASGSYTGGDKGPAPVRLPDAASPPHAVHCGSTNNRQAVGVHVNTPLETTLYCLMGCIAAVHNSPELLSRTQSQLTVLLAELARLEAVAEECHDKAEGKNQAHTLKKSISSRWNFEENEDEEKRKVQAAVEAAEEAVKLVGERIEDLEHLLQAGAESSIAAILAVITLPTLASRQLGHAQLMGAGAVMSMARAGQPGRGASPEDTDPLFVGPYRHLIHESGILAPLIGLATRSPQHKDSTLTHHTRVVVASAVAHMVATCDALSPSVLPVFSDYLHQAADHSGCGHLLASALWCMCRHRGNRKGLLKSPAWIELIDLWVTTGLTKIRRNLDANAISTSGGPALSSNTARLVRFTIMAAWLLVRQWLEDNMNAVNNLPNADGLYAEADTSWWAVKFEGYTSLTLSAEVLRALTCIVDIMHLPDGSGAAAADLRDLSVRTCWNLCSAHPDVASTIVSLGTAHLMMVSATASTANSAHMCNVVKYILYLSESPMHVQALGGLTQVCLALNSLIMRALSYSNERSEGVDVNLLEVCVRALSRIALKADGRKALMVAKSVRSLVSVVSVDNRALDGVRARRTQQGIKAHISTEELVSPLRAANHMSIQLGPIQRESAAILMQDNMPDTIQRGSAAILMQDNMPDTIQRGSAAILMQDNMPDTKPPTLSLSRAPSNASGALSTAHSMATSGGVSMARVIAAAVVDVTPSSPETSNGDLDSEVDASLSGEADAGLMAIWGLLNLSGYPPAQVAICRHGLYTLLRVVHSAADVQRTSAASSILKNIHYHPENATTLYKAELKLKHAALMQAQGIQRVQRFDPGRHPSKSGISKNNAAQALSSSAVGLLGQQLSSSVKEVAKMQGEGADANDPEMQVAEARMDFLMWLVDPVNNALGLTGSGDDAVASAVIGKDLTPADLMASLTKDPEESIYLRFMGAAEKLEGFEDFRHLQGSFMRGNLNRSLAEGAQSLWKPSQVGAEPKGAAAGGRNRLSSARNTRPSTAGPRTSGGAVANGKNAMRERASSARPRRDSPLSRSSPAPQGGSAPSARPQTASPGCASFRKGASSNTSARANTGSPPSKSICGVGAASKRTVGFMGEEGGKMGKAPPATASPRAGGQDPHLPSSRPGSAAWAPKILQFVQDRKSRRPRLHLAQRLLVAGVPKPAAETLSLLARQLLEGDEVQGGGEGGEEDCKDCDNVSSIAGRTFTALSQDASMRRSSMKSDVTHGGTGSTGVNEGGTGCTVGHRETQLKFEGNSKDGGIDDESANEGALGHSGEDGHHGNTLDDDEAGQGPHNGSPPESITIDLDVDPSCLADQPAGPTRIRPMCHTARSSHSFVASSLVQAGSLSSLPAQHRASEVGPAKGVALSRATSAHQRQQACQQSDLAQALQRPNTAYGTPQVGLVSPAGTTIKSLKKAPDSSSALLQQFKALSLIAKGQSQGGQDAIDEILKAPKVHALVLGDHVPRPTTIMDATIKDVVAADFVSDKAMAKAAAEAAAAGGDDPKTPKPVMAVPDLMTVAPLGLLIATGDGGPDKLYQFYRDTMPDPRHICLFEHVEGCKFCESLYGHYLLPSGKLAHVYSGDTVRKGHKVDLVPPPLCPFSAEDWFPDGLPSSTLLDSCLQPGWPAELYHVLWCPVPALGPLPEKLIMEWDDNGLLRLNSLIMVATLTTISKIEVQQTLVEPKPPPKPKKKKAAAGAKPGPRR